MATARKLPSGRWRVQTYDHGERRSYTAETKKEAERMAAMNEAQERPSRASMTLGEAMTAYIRTCRAQGYSPSTIAEYSARQRKSYPLLIDRPLSRIDVHDIQAQIDARAETRSVKTVRNDFYLLRAVLSVYAPHVRLDRIRLARRPKRPKMVLREAMPAQILAAVAGMPADFQIYVMLSMFAGLRPSETAALRWADLGAEPILVDADPPYRVGTVRVSAAMVRDEKSVYQRKTPKTESGNRTQQIAWGVFERIYALKPRGADEDPVVTMKPASATRRWQLHRGQLPVPPAMRLYDLRHLYATSVVASGASEEELAARMGHSTSAFSHAVYVELFEERRQHTNAALARAAEQAVSGSV